jgi:Flp pilus assembly protein TadD
MSEPEKAERAIRSFKQAQQEWHPSANAFLGIALAQLGRRKEARTELNGFLERAASGYVPSSIVARLYFALGEKEEGFGWLEKAYEERDFWLSNLKTDPMFSGIRPDPRYHALLKKMNLIP